MELLLTAEEFIEQHIPNTCIVLPEWLVAFAQQQIMAELEKHIEHPGKPGYKRSDIIARIKELKQQKV